MSSTDLRYLAGIDTSFSYYQSNHFHQSGQQVRRYQPDHRLRRRQRSCASKLRRDHGYWYHPATPRYWYVSLPVSAFLLQFRSCCRLRRVQRLPEPHWCRDG